MTISHFRLPNGRVFGRAVLLGLLIALPFACDDDGTSPPDPDPDELPDTIPSGTYEVGDLVVAEGDTFTISGDVVILSSGTVVVEGGFVLEPGATLGISAEDSLIIAGTIGGAEPGPSSVSDGPSRSATGSRAVLGTAYLTGDNVVFRTEESFGVEQLYVSSAPDGVITLERYLTIRNAGPSMEPGVPGQDGGHIHIGGEAANARWEGTGVVVGRPALIDVRAGMQAGDGSGGYTEPTGVLIERVMHAVGSDGGRGGDLVMSAREIHSAGLFLGAGDGGYGGNCGLVGFDEDPHTPITGAPGTAEGEPGVGILCRSGSGGGGGNAIITADVVLGTPRGGRGGRPGSAVMRAGNGGPGGRGGNIELFAGTPGESGTPNALARDTVPIVFILDGGIGGASPHLGLAGGDGGSIALLEIGGGPTLTSASFVEGSVSNGGPGHTGCSTTPFAPGSPGGNGGALILAGQPHPNGIAGSFAGGPGSDGRGPGAGGTGGFDDAGTKIGDDGLPGDACNDPATVVSVTVDESILDEIEDRTLQVFGLGLDEEACEIFVNDQAVDGECTSSTEAEAIVPAEILRAGQNEACIENPPPGGGRGECGEFEMFNPAPLILEIDPPVGTKGADGDVVTITGEGFVEGATVLVNGEDRESNRIDDTHIEGHLTAEDLAQTGSLALSVRVDFGISPSSEFVYPIVNAAPALVSISPTSSEAGMGTFMLDVTGSGFDVLSLVYFNGIQVSTDPISGNLLRATIPGELTELAGEYTVTVVTPEPGGGTTVGATFTVVNRAPYVDAISPPRRLMNTEGFTLTLGGSHFGAGVFVVFDGDTFPATRISSTQITVEIPASKVTGPPARQVQVTVHNIGPLGPDGGVSNIVPFWIDAAPFVSFISPSSFTAGEATEVDVTGGNFIEGLTTVYLNDIPLATTFASPTNLNAVVDAEFINDPGIYQLTVEVEDVAVSEPVEVEVRNPVPVAVSLSHRAARVGRADLLITITGEDFVETSEVVLNSIPLATTFVDGNTLNALIPANMMDEVGTFQIYVFTPTPGGGVSANLPFDVFDRPTLTSVTPSVMSLGGPSVLIVVEGTGIISTARITINGEPVTTTYNEEDGTLQATFPEALRASAGVTEIGVRQGSLNSTNTLTVTVENPTPTLTSLTTTAVPVGTGGGPGGSFGLSAAGSGFLPESKVYINGVEAAATNYISGTELNFVVLYEQMQEEGTLDITVVTPGPGGGTSGVQQFVVFGPLTLVNITPSVLSIGGPAVLIEVEATGYLPGAQVTFDGEPVTTNVVDGFLVAELPESLRANAGTVTVGVVNGGLSSTNTQTITVENAAPTITGFSQDHTYRGSGDINWLIIFGTGFVEGTTVLWAGSMPLVIHVLSETSIYVTIPASVLGDVGVVQISVTVPGPGGGTAQRSFEVIEYEPSLIEIEPASAVAGSGSMVVTLHGERFDMDPATCNFDECSVVYWLSTGGVLTGLEVEERVDEQTLRVIVTADLLDDPNDDGVIFVVNTTGDPNPAPVPPLYWESERLPFDVLSEVDPCTVYEELLTGEQVDGHLGPGDCTQQLGMYTLYGDRFTYTPTQQAIDIMYSSTGTSYLHLWDGMARSDYVFSFGTPSTRRMLIPAGRQYQVINSTETGGDEEVDYGLLATNAASESITCSGFTASLRPGVVLNGQTLASTGDCNGFNRHIANSGQSYLDRVFLMAEEGETVRFDMHSDDFDALVAITCSGPYCPQSAYLGTTGPDGTNTLILTIPETNGSTWQVELLSTGANNGPITGSYDLESAILTGDQVPDPCDPNEPLLAWAQWGQASQFNLNANDCPASTAGDYYELRRVQTEEMAVLLDMTNDGAGMFRVYRDGDLIADYPPTYRRAFLPPGDYVIESSSLAGFVPMTVTLNIGAQGSEERLGCEVRSVIVPGAMTTQTLSDTFEDLTCSNSDGEGNERRFDTYDAWVAPGQTVSFRMSSAQVDAVLRFDVPSTAESLIDDDSGGGTAAMITWTNNTGATTRVEVQATTDFIDASAEGRTGVYVLEMSTVP